MKMLFKSCCLVVMFAFIALFATGCSHNFGGSTKGIGLRFTWQPDAYMPEINFGWYDTSLAVVKDNASFTYKSNGIVSGSVSGTNETSNAAADSTTTSKLPSGSGNLSTELTLTTGKQINGYEARIEIARAQAKAVAMWLAKNKGVADADLYLANEVKAGNITLNDAIATKSEYTINQEMLQNSNLNITVTSETAAKK